QEVIAIHCLEPPNHPPVCPSVPGSAGRRRTTALILTASRRVAASSAAPPFPLPPGTLIVDDLPVKNGQALRCDDSTLRHRAVDRVAAAAQGEIDEELGRQRRIFTKYVRGAELSLVPQRTVHGFHSRPELPTGMALHEQAHFPRSRA